MAEAVALFFDAPWNWVTVGMDGAVRTHIIRGELEASARLLGIPVSPALFADVRVMEDEALKVWSKRR